VFCAARERGSRRGSPNRSTQSANASVGPRQRSSSALWKRGASVRSVARRLNNNARSRWSLNTEGGKSSMMPCLFRSRAALTAPIPGMPE
jgi:hypothetical protein